jgi:AbiV family abortive infection protein
VTSILTEIDNKVNSYHEVAEAALENAEDLLDLAQHALASGISGHADALAITANEEIAKAFGCYLVGEELVSEDDEEFKELFRDHYVKTQQMLGFYLNATLVNLAQIGFFDAEDFLKNILTASPREIAKAEEEIEKQLLKETKKIQRRRTKGLYVGLQRRKGKIKIKKPKNVQKNRVSKTIQTVQDYLDLVSIPVRSFRDNPQARKIFKDFMNMIIDENKETATFELRA